VINEDNIQTYIKSGVVAVGLGRSLIPKKIFDYNVLAEVINKASQLIRLICN